MPSSLSAYDALAAHYDAVAGDAGQEGSVIADLIGRSHPTAITLLELACGTGEILARLTGRYQVAGLDISPGMLAVARRKLPAEVPLHLADMSRFGLGTTYDVVLCAYYGINHLLDFAAYRNAFDCAHAHLNPGGALIFDVLTTADLQALASAPVIAQQFGENYLRIKVQAAPAAFNWCIEIYELTPDGSYRLQTELVRTASFPLDRLRDSLAGRFARVELAETDGGLAGDKRIWFVCHKG